MKPVIKRVMYQWKDKVLKDGMPGRRMVKIGSQHSPGFFEVIHRFGNARSVLQWLNQLHVGQKFVSSNLSL